VIPQPRQIIRERQQRGALIIAEGGRLLLADAPDIVFEPRDRRETFVPPTLEFAGNQPVVGIDCIILTARTRRLIARLFQLPKTTEPWSLASLSEKLIKIGAKGRQPRSLCHFPAGRGGGVATDVRRHPVADRPAPGTTRAA
jgi:hypothetical protein